MNAVRLPPTRNDSEASMQSALGACVSQTVRRYLHDMDGTCCDQGLFALGMREVEMPLLREAMAWHGGNQSRTAAALGINRATLRKKLAQHHLL